MLKSTNGVTDASVNFANQTALIEYDPSIAKPVDLQNAVRSIGYDLVVDVDDPNTIKEEAQRKHYEEVKQRTRQTGIATRDYAQEHPYTTAGVAIGALGLLAAYLMCKRN